jgi:hypothetical protein
LRWCETHLLWPWTAFSDRKNLEEPIPTWDPKSLCQLFFWVFKATDLKSRFKCGSGAGYHPLCKGLISMDAARGAQLGPGLFMWSYALVNLQKTIEHGHRNSCF